jgi:hypothetical protein
LVSALVTDARAVLAVVEDADLDVAQAEAVGLGGLVAGQDVEPGEQAGSFRIARKVPADRVVLVVDPDARHMHKSRSSYRDGYKAHLAVEPETGLVCAAAPTPANAADGPTGIGLLAGRRPGSRCLAMRPRGWGDPGGAPGGRACPDDQADPAAGGGAGRVHQRRLRRRPPGQNGDLPGGAYGGDHPGRQGDLRLALWPCPLRARCTTAKHGRTLNLHPYEAELAAARRAAADPAFQQSYRRWRPMVERSIAWLVAKGHRRVRYRGLAATSSGCRCGWPRSTCAG